MIAILLIIILILSWIIVSRRYKRKHLKNSVELLHQQIMLLECTAAFMKDPDRELQCTSREALATVRNLIDDIEKDIC